MNKALIKSFLLITFTLLSVGCSFLLSGKSKSTTSKSLSSLESHSNFTVDEVKGQVLATHINGTPTEIKISYTACFRDAFQTDNPLPNALFKIHTFETMKAHNNNATASHSVSSHTHKNHSHSSSASSASSASDTLKPQEEECSDNTSFVFHSHNSTDNKAPSTLPKVGHASCLKLRTDAAGCLKWAEFYPYKAINESVWFGYRRGFEGTGSLTGLTIVPMAVNPLLALNDATGSALPLVDLRYYSEYQNRHFVKLHAKDISECTACSHNNTAINNATCRACEYKKGSLSQVVNYFFHQKAERPRLWLNELDINISQEFIPVKQPDNPQKKILTDFKVCTPDTKKDCTDPPGRFFKVQLEMPLKIQVKDHRGVLKLLPLTYGEYSVNPYLFLQSNHGENWSLHRDIKFVSANLIQGANNQTILRADFYLHMPYERYGLTTLLALKVRAGNDISNSFLPFEGIFSFPNHLSSVIGRHNLKINKQSIDFYEQNPKGVQWQQGQLLSLIDTLQLSMDPKENRNRKGFRRAGWEIKLNRFRFSDISLKKGECPTPIGRHIRYVGEVCIIDPLTGKTIPNTSFSIKRGEVSFDKTGRTLLGPITTVNTITADQNAMNSEDFPFEGQRENTSGEPITSPSYSTDATGCLQWVDKLYHTWYDRERYFVRKMVFSVPELGFEGEKMIAINPWHWGFIFFQDITQLGPSSVRVNPQAAERPRLVLHEFKSRFVNPVYAIDRWLGINIFQNLLFLFQVRIDRPGAVNIGFGGQRASSVDIRRGYYWLRFILVKAHTEEVGGQGNMVVNADSFIKNNFHHTDRYHWNDHIAGWVLNRDGTHTGQMMHTNLEYITHFDTYTQIRDRTVNSYVNFMFDLDQFIFIGSNNRVIVQLLPTDPKYYVYHENTCQVDPTRTKFVPFKNHELIARPFMGPFIPGERSNWNIWRILNEKALPEVSDDYLKNKLLQLQIKNTDEFIDSGKNNSIEHKLFLKLHSTLVVQTKNWSDKALSAVKNSQPVFKKLYQNINYFLNPPNPATTVTKDQLIESITQTRRFLTIIINSNKEDRQAQFFTQITNILEKLLTTLLQTNITDNALKKKVAHTRQAITTLINKWLGIFTKQEQQVTKVKKPYSKDNWSYQFAEDKYQSQGTAPRELYDFTNTDTDIATHKLSAKNMNRFAKYEGLKVIAMDNKKEFNRFITDLNTLNTRYNTEYKKMLKLADKTSFNNQIAEDIIQSNKLRTNHSDIRSDRNYLDKIEENQSIVWNNFPLIDKDDYFTFADKNQQMYLPEFSPHWMRTVLKNGIHSATIHTPEVMTFLHSLCFFWFEKFYDEYLDKNQLDALYDQQVEYYDYYRSTLQYLRHHGNAKQYRDFLDIMKEYQLDTPFSKNNLTTQNPFLRYDPELRDKAVIEKIGEGFNHLLNIKPQKKDIKITGVVSSLYQKMKDHSKSNYYSRSMGVMPGKILNNSARHYKIANQQHPFLKCVANPLKFFHTEQKIIVGDIGSDYNDITYEYGQMRALNVQTSYDWAYSVNWSMSKAFSVAVGSGLSLLGGLGDMLPSKLFKAGFAFQGIRATSDWNTQASESEGSRRQASSRHARGIYLNMNHSVFSIRLKNFRRCLVVRPKNLAFDGYKKSDQVWKAKWQNNLMYQLLFIKSGLLLCSEDIASKNKEDRILEDYFYIYQPFPGDQGQFQNPLNFRNRPYVMTIRGVTELEKIEFLLQSFVEPDRKSGTEDYNPLKPMTSMFFKNTELTDGMQRGFEQAKLWNKTGFYPGVYSVRHTDNNHFFTEPKRQEKGMLENFGNWLHQHNPLDLIRFEDGNEKPILDY